MKRLLSSGPEGLRRFSRNQRGSTTLIFAGIAAGVVGLAGLTIDVGRVYAAKSGFDAATGAAALAGANALLAANANASSVQSAVTNWSTAYPPPQVTSSSATATLSCVTSTANLPSCNGANPNAVTVTQTATVSTHFLKAFGVQSLTLSSTKTASKAGGDAKPLHVIFVLDATGSMGSTDTGCSIPGNNRPTRFQCALYSVQSVLKVMPTSMDKVGLMIFPGMATQYSPTSHPCPTQPNSTPYLAANIKYQIGTSLDATYNDGAGTLTNASPLVQAVGNGTSMTGCVTNKGGQGSYSAEVIAKAHAALPVVAGTQNVIVFLSDGDFSASASQLSNQTSKTSRQCGQAVDAAATAKAAGTKIYSVAYGAASSGCSSGDTYNPCSAMKAIATDAGSFFSTTAACKINGHPNAISGLPAIFQVITSSLTKPRMLN
ncbi:MAG: VWA domain-containing protein [Reyranella sp.]|nr:VWA domain-containing protein [Reyranella sp.]